MNLFAETLKDIKAFKADHQIRIIIFGMLLVPLIYAGIYLDAFWDPYGHTDELSIAFVNADKGVETEEGYQNYGRDAAVHIETNDDFDWVFLDTRDEAYQGVEDGTYYAMIVLPENFSEIINGIQDDELIHPQIEYVSNDKKNFIVSMISKKAADTIQSDINQSILASLAQSMTEGLNDVEVGMVAADNGVVQLSDGMLTLKLQIPKMSDGINTLAEGSDTFTEKMSDATDGATDLKEGLFKLNDQMPELQDGVSELYEGSGIFLDKLNQVQDGVNQINDAVYVLGDNIPALQDGTDQLAEGSLDLVDGMQTLKEGALELTSAAGDIGSGVSSLESGINSANSASTQLEDAMTLSKALMASSPTYQALATGGTTVVTSVATAESLVDGVYNTTAIPALQTALTQVMEGMDDFNAMLTGTGDSSDLTTALQTMTVQQLLTASLTQMSAGIVAVRDATDGGGTSLLDSGSIDDLNDAISELNTAKAVIAGAGDDINLLVVAMIDSEAQTGLSSLSTGMSALSSGAGELSEGVSTFNDAMPELVTGIDTAKDGSEDLSDGIIQLQDTIPTLENGILTLGEGTSKLSSSMLKMSDAGETIYDGIGTLNDSIPTMADGVAQMADGSDTLSTGMEKLTDASMTMNEGIHVLSDQVPDMVDGINQLYEGSVQLHDGLSEGIESLASGVQFSAKGIKAYAGEVAQLADTDVYTVDNYGQSLSPYFDSLALWVGSLIIFVLLKFKGPKEVIENPVQYVAGKYSTFLIISLLQATALSVVILIIGLRPVSIIGFFAFNYLLSICFVAIQQMLNFLFGNVGKLLSMILLVLQLTSANGTFPVELEPGFFQAISKFMPFTYSIIGLRELISGVQWQNMAHSIIALLLFAVLSFTATATAYWYMSKKRMTRFSEEALNESI